MIPWGMKDEVIPVRFRPNWIRGSLHFFRSGCIEFVVTACDPEIFCSVAKSGGRGGSSGDIEVAQGDYYDS